MARINQTVRDSRGRYIRVNIVNKIKSFCSSVVAKIEKWLLG